MQPTELATCIVYSTIIGVIIVTLGFIGYIIYFWIYGYYGSECVKFLFTSLGYILEMFTKEISGEGDAESKNLLKEKQCLKK